jgi:hypothetical protein
MRIEHYRRRVSALWLITLLAAASFTEGHAAETLILYPKVTPPIQRIYSAIIEGIQNNLPKSDSLAITQDTQPAELTLSLRANSPVTIIALGKTTAEKIKQSGYKGQLIVAATLFDPGDYRGVSLAIDSRALIEKIHTLLPFIKRVFILDSPTRSRISLQPKNLNSEPRIIPFYDEDPLVITRKLAQLLEQEASPTDAILLPSHIDRNILYEMARLAWDNKIILLSTNLAHLKDGVLLAFYPDNVGMGKQIAAFSQAEHGEDFQSLRYLNSALNPTLAKHLGIDFSPAVLSQFELQVK